MWIFNAYSLKKLEFKVQIAVSVEPFQLLQQNSRHILREHSHRKSESLAQIRATITELQHFLRDCCLLAHPVDSIKAIQLRSSSCRWCLSVMAWATASAPDGPISLPDSLSTYTINIRTIGSSSYTYKWCLSEPHTCISLMHLLHHASKKSSHIENIQFD